MFDYATGQIDRIVSADPDRTYSIKVMRRDDVASTDIDRTHWLRINLTELTAIREVLARRER